MEQIFLHLTDYRRFEKLNEDIALNVRYIPFNKEGNDNGIETIDVEQEYISNFSFTRKKEVVLIRISNGKKWYFLALKSDQEENIEFITPTKSFSRLNERYIIKCL